MGRTSERWHKLDGAELAQQVTRIVDGLCSAYAHIDDRARRGLELYEGRRLAGLSPESYLEEDDGTNALQLNVTRSACDYALAEIAGRQKPKVSFLTTGASYQVRRKARKLERFVEAQMRVAQGNYYSMWEVMEDAFMDALTTGTGIVYPYADGDSMVLERVPPGQVRLDLHEAAGGNPRNWFRRAGIDADLALDLFASGKGDSHKAEAIENAPTIRQDVTSDLASVSPPIEYTEAWFLPLTDKPKGSEGKWTPGRHVIVIGDVVMLDEPWETSEPPFIILRWKRQRLSFWGKGLPDEGEKLATELDENTEKLQARFRLCGAKRTYVVEGSLKNESEMERNEHETIVFVKSGMEMPKEYPPAPVASSEVDWHASVLRWYFEMLGVSQTGAAARKEQGITAAVAIRTVNDMQTLRFSVPAKGYEQAYVPLGKAIVRCARQIAKRSPGYELPWPGSSFHGTIKWADVDLGEDTYVVQLLPSSSLPSTLSGKLQLVSELFQAGVISAETFKRLVDMPDLEQEMKSEGAERERIEYEIDRMLDAQEGEDFDIHTPDGYILDPMGAMVLVGGEYHRAIVEQAPEFNLKLLRAWMADLDQIIARKMQTQPTPGAAGGVAPSPPAPAPGGPSPQAAAPQLPLAG